MTTDQARDEIFHAIVDCELMDTRGNPYPALREVQTAKELGTALFNALKAKGLLKLDDEENPARDAF
jgi:hypothetical protein